MAGICVCVQELRCSALQEDNQQKSLVVAEKRLALQRRQPDQSIRLGQQQSLKHHYIPCFYLRRWTAADGMVCEFSRPHKIVRPKRTPPEATGFQIGLYTVTGVEPASQSVIEDDFFRRADQKATDALAFMLANHDGSADMPSTLRSGWSRFILSLQHRNPETLAQLKAKCAAALRDRLPEIEASYDDMRGLDDPLTFAELKVRLEHDVEHKMWAVLLQDVVDSITVGAFINRMHWSIVTLQGARHRLLTSDRPVYMTNGIDHPEGQIIIPVGHNQVFVAVTTPEMEVVLRAQDGVELIRKINDGCARRAERFVYDTDDRQLRFVENRLRRLRPGHTGE